MQNERCSVEHGVEAAGGVSSGVGVAVFLDVGQEWVLQKFWGGVCIGSGRVSNGVGVAVFLEVIRKSEAKVRVAVCSASGSVDRAAGLALGLGAFPAGWGSWCFWASVKSWCCNVLGRGSRRFSSDVVQTGWGGVAVFLEVIQKFVLQCLA